MAQKPAEGASKALLAEKVDSLIAELKHIQAHVSGMSLSQRERYISISKRLIELQEKVRSPHSN